MSSYECCSFIKGPAPPAHRQSHFHHINTAKDRYGRFYSLSQARMLFGFKKWFNVGKTMPCLPSPSHQHFVPIWDPESRLGNARRLGQAMQMVEEKHWDFQRISHGSFTMKNWDFRGDFMGFNNQPWGCPWRFE